jgi:hypothetical protein
VKFEWVIPVVVLIVWLLNKLLRGQENDEAVKPARGPATRSPASDIDRFLEEIDRMRKAGGAPPAAAIPVARPVPVELARAVPAQRLRPAAPVALPALLGLPEPGQTSVQVPEAAKPFVSAFVRRRSPIAETLSAMLRSPQSIRAAVILQEVLGKPKGLRGRREM